MFISFRRNNLRLLKAVEGVFISKFPKVNYVLFEKQILF